MGFALNYLMNLCSLARGIRPERPLLFSYYVTHRCMLNCKYCCDGGGRRFKEDQVQELDTASAKILFSIIAKASDTVDITGGEPMLRDDLEELLAHAKGCGLRTVLNTKGLGLEARPDLVRHSDVLVLSLDSLSPGQLAGLIGDSIATADRIISGLEYALGKCRKLKNKLVLSAVATPENLKEVEGVLEYALKNRLGFHISPEIVGTRVNPALRDNATYRQLIDKLIGLKASDAGVLGVAPYLKGIRDFDKFPCHPLLMPVVRPDGRIYYPCLESKQAEISLLDEGDYGRALAAATRKYGPIPSCGDCCHIFCHMALSLFQRHPLAALGESKHWRSC